MKTKDDILRKYMDQKPRQEERCYPVSAVEEIMNDQLREFVEQYKLTLDMAKISEFNLFLLDNILKEMTGKPNS